ncbi:hypothetical protein C2S53_018858 [Perilla frutescens var. hirtella]|uniref:FAF domain-containing protein n=1 Tax=Perilla frutescens var. hirtella TaxID=608512 RepID=A0AAD4P0I5_PERFH|nr:hypothetical protein C2S53_018858 [Perilla frutescens var. hirtella]
MSTIVCQNLVSCFESQLTETTTTLKLKVAAAPPPAAMDFNRKPVSEYDHSPRTLEFGNWGFLQTNSKESMDKDCCYTHKNSSFSKLSPKSLQLCTENLGSETGSDTISDCSSIFSASPPLSPTSNSGEDHKTVVLDDWKLQKIKSPPANAHGKEACRNIKNFPPPLTTMSGSSSLQVRRHREGGRLIIEAVEGPFRNSYLQAERSDGRLKLCFTTATSSGGEEQEEEEEEEQENEDECAAEEEVEEPINEFELEKEEFDEEINLVEKFQRLSRCKEGGHGNKSLCSNWKPALWEWVATS